VRPVQEKYNMLFNDTDNFLENNQGADVEQILDIMESHDRRVLMHVLHL
jgi:shikimate kinase